MAAWIDFKRLREELSFLEVLNHYGVAVTVKGDKATGLCPLPDHPKRENGGKRTPSFSCNLPRKIWRCFGCNAGGNLLDFAVRMDGGNPDDVKTVRRTAVKLAQAFKIDTTSSQKSDDVRPKPKAPEKRQDAIVNPPLDFALQGLDPRHPYFREHGITPGIVEQFGLGYCGRGMLKFRIAIPMHNEHGQLVGYAGRLTKDKDISDDNPKYRFPGDRERDGKKIEFRKSKLVYNLHRLPKPIDRLVIVEGFRSVWWLTRWGFPNVVALMGSDCSSEQANLIESVTGEDTSLIFLTDGDSAGEDCATSLFREMGHRRWCIWRRLNPGVQPTALTRSELANLIK